MLLPAAGIAGFLCVALGAFGAHGLEGRLTDEAAHWWTTATFYGLTHSVAALAAALAARASPGLRLAGWAFVIGALIFSGTLYAMALLSLDGDAPRRLGAITPVGGVSLLIGWGLVVFQGFRQGFRKSASGS